MKKLFTSYYAKSGQHPNRISISASEPPWFMGKRYPRLAPSWDMIWAVKHGTITDEQYGRLYLELLIKKRKLDPNTVVKDLPNNAVLLCYERPDDFCHRHIVARWLRRSTGIQIHELDYTPSIDDHFDL